MIDLTTPEEVKCRLETVTNDFDADIASYITDVSTRIQTWIDRDLELQSYTEIHDGGGVRIYPRQVPVISITEIKESVTLNFATSGIVVPSEDYALVNEGWDIAHVVRWPGKCNSIQLVYMSGFLDASDPTSLLPKDLRAAATRQVAYEFRYRKFDGLSAADVADGALVKEDKIWLDAVKPILRKYMKAKLG
jgi:hypothetical protein